MKPLLFFGLFLFLISCSKDFEVVSTEQEPQIAFLGELEFVRSYGGSGEDTARAIIETSDGGYAILGYSNSTDGDLQGKTLAVNDYWLSKLDAQGELQWSKTYGGSKDDRGQGLVQTQDGGYALTGYAMSDDGDGSVNNGFHDNWILKVDAQGVIEWEKSYGFSGHDHSYDILDTGDGGFFFTGFLDITSARADGNTEKRNTIASHGVGEFWGTKIDSKAKVQWRGYYGGTNNDRAHAAVRADDGGYVMAGFTESDDFDINNSRGSYDFWVVKIDEGGELVWQQTFGGTGIERAQDIAKTTDGGYVIIGNTFSADVDISENHGESDIWLIKIDGDGNLLWNRSFGGTQFDDAQSVTTSKDGGFIISGNSKSSDGDANLNAGENDIWLLKTDAQGEMVWQKSFGGSGFDYGFDALETSSGAIVLVGEISSDDFENLNTKGSTDVVVIRVK
ncbi:MAG: lipoprotein [Maribacter sp.]